MEYSKILVGVDGTDMDEANIKCAHYMAKICKSTTVYIMHVARDLEVPQAILNQYPDLKESADETLKKRFEELADAVFSDSSQVSVHIEIKEGHPEKELLRWTKIKDIDLVIMGRKPEEEHSGVLTSKLMRSVNCSFIMVPPVEDFKLETIYVATDFSEESILALETANTLKESAQAKLVIHHIYQIPSGYHKSGKNQEEFAEIMQKNAEQSMSKISKKLHLDNYRFEASLSDGSKMGLQVVNFAQGSSANLIVMGSKGKTATASMMLGSVTEKTAYYAEAVAMLVVRRKGENMDFLDAIING